MLKHVMKYEWKAVSRLLVLVHIAMLAFCALAYATTSLLAQKSGAFGALSTLFWVLYLLCIAVAAALTILVPAVRYYKSMYGEEGYLSHSIPAKTSTLILGRELVYLIWSLIDIFCILLPLVLGNWNDIIGAEGLPGLFSEFSRLAALAGAPLPLLLLYFFLFGLSLVVLENLLAYFAISIGSYFSNHKGIASVIAYILSGIATEVIGSLVLLASFAPYHNQFDIRVQAISADAQVTIGGYQFYQESIAFARSMMHFSVICFFIVIGFCALFWSVSWYTADKKMNLA